MGFNVIDHRFGTYCVFVFEYGTTVYHIMSYHIISYHIIIYHIILYIMSYHTTSHHIISHHIIYFPSINPYRITYSVCSVVQWQVSCPTVAWQNYGPTKWYKYVCMYVCIIHMDMEIIIFVGIRGWHQHKCVQQSHGYLV
jgi:hypothetical protein